MVANIGEVSTEGEAFQTKFCCPKCGSVLSSPDQPFTCPDCSAEWPVEDGIPRFIEDAFYWGFTSQDTMSKTLHIAETEGWAKGVDYYIAVTHPTEADFYRDYACNEERANWRFLLPMSPDSKVIDIGSGLGIIATALSRVVGEVVALDATYENLRFVDIRCRQEGIANVTTVNADIVHYPRLPFPDNYFDLASMIGVLEWTGDAQPEVRAMETQKSVLKKVWRVLKPDGKLYLAIENRFGFRYFLGKADEHTNLRFATLLPRGLADFYSRAIRKKPYRTYTHSLAGLGRLLRDCGFSGTRFYSPILYYVNPNYYVSLESPEPFDYLLSHSLRGHPRMNPVIHNLGRLAIRLGLQRIFCPAFAVIAEK